MSAALLVWDPDPVQAHVRTCIYTPSFPLPHARIYYYRKYIPDYCYLCYWCIHLSNYTLCLKKLSYFGVLYNDFRVLLPIVAIQVRAIHACMQMCAMQIAVMMATALCKSESMQGILPAYRVLRVFHFSAVHFQLFLHSGENSLVAKHAFNSLTSDQLPTNFLNRYTTSKWPTQYTTACVPSCS